MILKQKNVDFLDNKRIWDKRSLTGCGLILEGVKRIRTQVK